MELNHKVSFIGLTKTNKLALCESWTFPFGMIKDEVKKKLTRESERERSASAKARAKDENSNNLFKFDFSVLFSLDDFWPSQTHRNTFYDSKKIFGRVTIQLLSLVIETVVVFCACQKRRKTFSFCSGYDFYQKVNLRYIDSGKYRQQCTTNETILDKYTDTRNEWSFFRLKAARWWCKNKGDRKFRKKFQWNFSQSLVLFWFRWVILFLPLNAFTFTVSVNRVVVFHYKYFSFLSFSVLPIHLCASSFPMRRSRLQLWLSSKIYDAYCMGKNEKVASNCPKGPFIYLNTSISSLRIPVNVYASWQKKQSTIYSYTKQYVTHTISYTIRVLQQNTVWVSFSVLILFILTSWTSILWFKSFEW